MADDPQSLEHLVGLIEEALADMTTRVGAIEQTMEERSAALEAAESVQKSALAGGEALLTAIRALNAPIGAQSLEAVLGKIDDVARIAQQLTTDLSRRIDEQSRQQTEFSAKETADTLSLNQQLGAVATRLDAFREEFLGKLAEKGSINPCGAWSATETYSRGDMVSHDGSSWVSMEGGNREKPSEKSKKWMLAARRGGNIGGTGGGGGGGGGSSGGLILVSQDSNYATFETA